MSKNILIVSEFFPPIIKGGAAAGVFSLAKSLQNSENNVIVLTIKGESEEKICGFEAYESDFRKYYYYFDRKIPIVLSKILTHIYNTCSFTKIVSICSSL
ncbi:unnamed protein product [marine sediment metagenome]|uniref:Uncharacterized protein n=1 Tax=marine sediment metagenome TaxID=412755 RepID=X1H2C8_9ZZZZ